jgi:hypothetical protein
VTVAGEKAKFWMVIESELVPPPLEDAPVDGDEEALLPPEEHAASASAIPMRITATINLT